MSSQKQTQSLKLLQKLSPQQILLMKLLQIPSVGLEERIKEEIEENPALEGENMEDESADEQTDSESESLEDNFDTSDDTNNSDESPEDFDPYDYNEFLGDDDEVSGYKYQVNNTGPDDDRYETPIVNELSFQDYLIQQLGYRMLSDKKYKIGTCIIGNLDDSGYLTRPVSGIVDDLIFSMNIDATEQEVDEVLQVIKEFDPAGVAAQNLQDCLLIQLNRLQNDNPEDDYADAQNIIKECFPEFTKKHYDKIVKMLSISDERLKAALDVILKLNPKPGNSVGETSKNSHYIIPDFYIVNNSGKLELSLNSKNDPELRVSRTYVEMLGDLASKKSTSTTRDAMAFVKQKIESARWFIDAIKQRQNTLLVTMNAIMEYQKKYFLTGDETQLRPMILKDIADIVGLDISTISRVANSKYVQTDFGTFLLKSFFSESMLNDEGEEVSTREIKKILNDYIEAEDKTKPLTDEGLAAVLKEKGYNIARRTVQKYREQLDIPVARLRKQL